ncbi:MAG: TatD family hydrolase, partial [Myxococcota bacterium]
RMMGLLYHRRGPSANLVRDHFLAGRKDLHVYVDAHCHLERGTYGDELKSVLERAFGAGLSHLVAVVATRVSEGAKEAVALAETDERIFATAGIHPHDVAKATEVDFDVVHGFLSHPRVVSLGEIGLDYHYDFAPKDVQTSAFERQLKMAQNAGLPVMLHTREAHEDTLACLDRAGLPEQGGVVHCFTGSPEEASDYLERGMYLSIPGVVTFKGKSADPLRDAIRDVIPLDRLFVETDSPYLAPVPYRGKRNEPAYVVETAAKVAELKGMDREALGEATRQNAIEFFRLGGAE